MSTAVTTFRERFRDAQIGPRYTGWGHFWFTTVGAIAAIVFAATRLHDVHGAEWAMFPISFLISNLGEYLAHRGPMHRPRRGLGLLFERHTQQHHHFFTHDKMSVDGTRDFKIVLFPPVMLIFFLGVVATPIAALLHFVWSANAGWIFALVAISYFLSYEWLHFAYHQPPASVIGRMPFVATLRAHHMAHHDLALMGKWNFNITFPIADWLFGTTYRKEGP